MEAPKPTNDLQLGILIAKADSTLAAVSSVASEVKALGDRLRALETDVTSKISGVERELGARIVQTETRIVVLESQDSHKRQNLTLYVALASIAGTLASLAKVFGLL